MIKLIPLTAEECVPNYPTRILIMRLVGWSMRRHWYNLTEFRHSLHEGIGMSLFRSTSVRRIENGAPN